METQRWRVDSALKRRRGWKAAKVSKAGNGERMVLIGPATLDLGHRAAEKLTSPTNLSKQEGRSRDLLLAVTCNAVQQVACGVK